MFLAFLLWPVERNAATTIFAGRGGPALIVPRRFTTVEKTDFKLIKSEISKISEADLHSYLVSFCTKATRLQRVGQNDWNVRLCSLREVKQRGETEGHVPLEKMFIVVGISSFKASILVVFKKCLEPSLLIIFN